MRILLIEDDQFFQKFYAAKLKEQGFEVFTANDGEQGLAQTQAVQPALIILDIIMPKKDGFAVLQTLAQNPNLQKIPVIVFSTLGQEQDVAKAKSLGARDYVDKSSFDFSSLKNKILALVPKS